MVQSPSQDPNEWTYEELAAEAHEFSVDMETAEITVTVWKSHSVDTTGIME